MSEAIQYYTDINLNGGQLLEAGFQLSPTAPADPVVGQFYFNTTVGQFQGYNGTEWVNLSQVIQNAITMRGGITDAATNPAFPATPVVGDSFMITTTAGTVGGLPVDIGDQLLYTQDGWMVIQSNLQQATDALAGYVRLATQTEANAGTPGLAITPETLAGYLEQFLYGKLSINLIGTLTANTPRDVVHNLGLTAATDMTYAIWHNNSPIGLSLKAVDNVTARIESNKTLNNVKVVFNG